MSRKQHNKRLQWWARSTLAKPLGALANRSGVRSVAEHAQLQGEAQLVARTPPTGCLSCLEGVTALGAPGYWRRQSSALPNEGQDVHCLDRHSHYIVHTVVIHGTVATRN